MTPNLLRDHLDLVESLSYAALLDESARSDFLVKTYADKLDQKWTAVGSTEPASVRDKVEKQPGETLGEKLVNFFLGFDPSKNQQYAQWMVVRWLKDGLRLEDLPEAKDALVQFEQEKKNLEVKDINGYRTLGDLVLAIRGSVETHQQQVDDEYRQAIHDSTVVLDNGKWLIVIPNNQFSACYWGRPTTWCTAYGDPKGRNPTRTSNLYSHYAKNGPLYIIVRKADGERWQFHFPSQQFMDREDRAIPLGEFIRKNPDVFQAIGERNFLPYIRDIGIGLFSENAIAGMGDGDLSRSIRSLDDFNRIPERRITEELIDYILSINNAAIEWLPQKYWKDRVAELVRNKPMLFLHLPQEMRTPELAQVAARENEELLGSDPEHWADNIRKHLWTHRAQAGRLRLEQIPEDLREVPEILFACLMANMEDIPKYADIIPDKVAKALWEKNIRALEYLPERFLTKEVAEYLSQDRFSTNWNIFGRFPSELWPNNNAVANAILGGGLIPFSRVPEHWRTSPELFVKWYKARMRRDEADIPDVKYFTPEVVGLLLREYADVRTIPEQALTLKAFKEYFKVRTHGSEYVWKSLPPSVKKNQDIVALFMNANIVPIEEMPRNLWTDEAIAKRLKNNPSEVESIPEDAITAPMAEQMAAANWKTMSKIPDRLLTKEVLSAYMSNFDSSYNALGYGSTFSANLEESKKQFLRFDPKLRSSKDYAIAIAIGWIKPEFKNVPSDLVSEDVAVSILRVNPSQWAKLPSGLNKDSVADKTLEANPELIEHIPENDLSEKIMAKAIERFGEKYYKSKIEKVLKAKDRYTPAVWKEAVGRTATLKDVPAKMRTKDVVISALTRDPRSTIPTLKSPVKWINETLKAGTSFVPSWVEQAESVGVLLPKKSWKVNGARIGDGSSFIDVRDLPKETPEKLPKGYAASLVTTGPNNRKLFLFGPNGRVVARMSTNRGGIVLPEANFLDKYRKAIFEAANIYLSGFSANDLVNLGIHDSSGKGFVLEESTPREKEFDVEYTKLPIPGGERWTIYNGSTPVIQLDTGTSGGWGGSFKIVSSSLMNIPKGLEISGEITNFVNRKLPSGGWSLTKIGIFEQRGGWRVSYCEKKIGTIDGLDIWTDKDRTRMALTNDKEGVVSRGRVLKNGTITRVDYHGYGGGSYEESQALRASWEKTMKKVEEMFLRKK